MGSHTTFLPEDLADLDRCRGAARKALALPDIVPPGWHHDVVDLGAAIAAFPTLSLRSGWELRASHFREEVGCVGWVWAFPSGADLSERLAWGRHHTAAQPPAPPPGAAPPMQALSCDATDAWSWLCAAVLQRELGEPGCTGAYRKWGKHELLDHSPWDDLNPVQRREALDHYGKGLYWFDRFPSDLRPRVEDRAGSISVRFFTRRLRAHMPVYLHEDRFGSGGLHGQLGRRLIGRVPIGRGLWPGFE